MSLGYEVIVLDVILGGYLGFIAARLVGKRKARAKKKILEIDCSRLMEQCQKAAEYLDNDEGKKE